MALSASLLGAITFNTTAGVKTVVATPTLGDMIVVIVAATGVASGLGVTDNNADNHGRYTQIVSSVKAASVDQMAAFVRADPVRSATSTTWTTSGDGASTGGGLYVMRITGATLAGAAFIRQSGKQDNGAAAGTPTIPLGVGAALTTNALISAVFNATNPAGTTVPAGWAVADVNTGYITPTTGITGSHINSGSTVSSVTWGGTSASAFSALAFEMSAAQGNLAVSPEVPQEQVQQAVKRGAFFMTAWQKRRSGLIAPEPGILVPA